MHLSINFWYQLNDISSESIVLDTSDTSLPICWRSKSPLRYNIFGFSGRKLVYLNCQRLETHFSHAAYGSFTVFIVLHIESHNRIHIALSTYSISYIEIKDVSNCKFIETSLPGLKNYSVVHTQLSIRSL